MQYVRSLAVLFLLLAVFGSVANIYPQTTYADEEDEIQEQIDAHNEKIRALDEEIKQYQAQLTTLSAQNQTLQTAIKSIDVSRSQTSTQIKSTQSKISASNLKLQELSGDISKTEYELELNRRALENSLRDMATADNTSLIEYLLGSDSIADAWTSMDAIASLSRAMRENTASLLGSKTILTQEQEEVSTTKQKLTSLSTDLSNQQKQLDISKAEKDRLLKETKSQEAAYQQLIAQKRAEQASFEAALFDLSSRLQNNVDPSAIPSAGAGILRWPLDTVRITQQFGRTSDSGRLYASGTHDGIDFGIPTGSAVYAALSGTVLEVNQGAVPNCQYGKWVVIKHANGLSTLYAHLSQISVSKGQTVTTGQTIGYSGMTGYATGPHLHFTVYVSEGLTFKQYACKAGPTVTIPIAPPTGYLNPTAYL